MMRRGRGPYRRGPGLVGTVARTAVVAGTATAVVGGVNDRRAAKQADQAAMADSQAQQQQMAAQQQAQQQQLDAMQQQQATAQAAQAAQPAQAATAPAVGGLTPDAMARLQQLAELQKQGILTEEEFAQQKAKILAV